MKNYKRVLVLVLALALALTTLQGIAFAEDNDAEAASTSTIRSSGTCGADGDNLTWTLDSEGTLTITGSGQMSDFEFMKSPWIDSVQLIKKIVITGSVTSIGEFAFFECDNLTSIIISDSVTTIGRGAFAECNALTSINLPSNLVSIGSDAFSPCASLTSITIPDSVTSIGESAFMGCTKLETISLSSNLTKIEAHTFSSCTSLKSVTIPVGVKEIGKLAFNVCTMNSITIPYTVTKIDTSAFASFAVSVVRFMGNAPKIGKYAFNDVTATVYYPANNTTWTTENMLNYGGKLTWTTAEPILCNFNVYVSDLDNSYKFLIYPSTMTDTEIRADLSSGSQVLMTVIPNEKVIFEEDGMLTQHASFNITQGNYKFILTGTDTGGNSLVPAIITMAIHQDGGLDCGGLSQYGDIDGDGEFSVWDATRAYAALTGTKTLDDYSKACADLNNDGELTVWEVTQIYNKVING